MHSQAGDQVRIPYTLLSFQNKDDDVDDEVALFIVRNNVNGKGNLNSK